MSSATAPLLLTPSEIGKDRNPSRVFLDASWHMPGSPRNAREEFKQKRLPGARFLDLDEVASSHKLGLKHMMPSGSTFAQACESLGIEPSSHVVIYDSHGVFSSPRALFMFRAFGHNNSSVLNGGLPRWVAEGFPLEESASPAEVVRSTYPEPKLDESVVRSYEQVVTNSSTAPAADGSLELLLDARSRGRWLGTDPEPRPGLSSGHVPHSFSLPFNTFLTTIDGPNGEKYTTLRSPAELDKEVGDVLGPEFTKQAKAGERSVITSCGSGMTAGVLWLGLGLLDVKKIGLYDESWTGYAMRESSVIQRAT